MSAKEREVTEQYLGRGAYGFFALSFMALTAVVLLFAVPGWGGGWDPFLTVGKNPVALVAIPGGVAVVCRGPSSEAEAKLKEVLTKELASASGARESVLEKALSDLPTISTVMLFGLTTDGYLWAHREYLLYRHSESLFTAENKSQTTTISGVVTAAVCLKKGETDFLLVGTKDGPVYEINLKTYALVEREDLPQNVVSMAVGDLIGDDRHELVIAHDRKVVVYKVDGDKFRLWQEWSGGPGGQLGTRPSFVTIADLNGDGAGDIVVANDGQEELTLPDGRVEIYRDIAIHAIISERTGFLAPVPYRATLRPRSLVVGDFTSDGVPDVVVAGAEAVVLLQGIDGGKLSDKPKVLMGWDKLTPVDPATFDFLMPPPALAAADLDLDGKQDLVVGDPATGQIRVFYGRDFGTPKVVFTATSPSAVMVHNIGGDGYYDLLIADAAVNRIFVLAQHIDGWDQMSHPRQGIGAGLGLAMGSSPTSTYLAIASPLLTESAPPKTKMDVRVNIYPRPGGLPSDQEALVRSMGYIFYEPIPPSVDPLVAQGGAVAGAPNPPAGEKPDGSFAAVYDRNFTGPKPEENLPRLGAGATGPMPRGVILGDISPHGEPDVVVWFADGTIKAAQSPWPKRATTRTITMPSLPEEVSVATATLANFDADPTDDLVVVDQNTGNLYVLLNGRAPSWVRYVGQGVGPAAVVASDIDGDGRADVAIVNSFSNDVTIFWGKGDGTFVRHPQQIHVGPRPVALAAARSANKTTLVVANSVSDTVTVITFSGRVAETASVSLGRSGPVAVASAKSLDWLAGRPKDDYPDFIVACYAANDLVLLLGKEHDGFEVVPIRADARLSNIVGYEVTQRGDGPLSVVVADFDGDGVEDVAFSVAFEKDRLQLDPVRVDKRYYADAVKRQLEALPQDVFIYYSSRNPLTVGDQVLSPPPLAIGFDVFVGHDGTTPVVAVLHTLENGQESGRRVSMLALQPDGINWRLIKQIPVEATTTRLIAADLNNDQRLDLAVLDPIKNQVTVFWQVTDAQPTTTTLSTPPAPVVIMCGTSSVGSWLLAGERVWTFQTRPTPDRVLDLVLQGGTVRAATAVQANGRGPPDLVVLTTRNNLQVFSGTELFVRITTPSLSLQLPEGYWARQVVAGYFDADNKLDFVFSFVRGTEAVRVHLGQGMQFDLGPQLIASAYNIAISDFNGDGTTDVVTLWWELGGMTCLRVFPGTGGGKFVQPISTWFRHDSPWTDGGLVVADVDSDGKLDAIVWDRSRSAIFVFWQRDVEGKYQIDNITVVTKRLNLQQVGHVSTGSL